MAEKIERLGYVVDEEPGLVAKWKAKLGGSCILATVSRGIFGDRKEKLGVPVDYVGSAAIPPEAQAAAHGSKTCVLAYVAGKYRMLVGADEMAACSTVSDLKERLLSGALAQNMELPDVIIET